MREVLDDELVTKLGAHGAVADGDGQPDLAGVDGALADEDAACVVGSRQAVSMPIMGLSGAGLCVSSRCWAVCAPSERTARTAVRVWPGSQAAVLQRTCGEASDHGAEALGHAGDAAAVVAALIHAGKGVQHVVTGHARVVEPDAAVVHTVQAHLGAVVLDAHAWGEGGAADGDMRASRRRWSGVALQQVL